MFSYKTCDTIEHHTLVTNARAACKAAEDALLRAEAGKGGAGILRAVYWPAFQRAVSALQAYERNCAGAYTQDWRAVDRAMLAMIWRMQNLPR